MTEGRRQMTEDRGQRTEISRIDEIVELIQQEARVRKGCTDYVSALYTVSMEIRVKIMKIMDHLRGKERERKFSKGSRLNGSDNDQS